MSEPVQDAAQEAAAGAASAAEGFAEKASQTAGRVFEDIKTSLPRLDIFDPSVFDMRMVLGMLALFGLVSYFAFRLYMSKVVGGDDFISDLGISYAGFELPDEVDEYYEAKEQATDIQELRNPLLKRAIADIPIILRLQKEGPGMQNMYQQAMIGDKEWQAYQLAESIISEEIEEVQAEAEQIEAGWGEKIWRLASELRQALMHRQQQMELMMRHQQQQETAAATVSTPSKQTTVTDVTDDDDGNAADTNAAVASPSID